MVRDGQRAAERTRDSGSDGQAEADADASLKTRAFGTVERFEDMVEVFESDAATEIFHFQDGEFLAVARFEAGSDDDRSAVRRIFAGVIDQIVKQLRQQRGCARTMVESIPAASRTKSSRQGWSFQASAR